MYNPERLLPQSSLALPRQGKCVSLKGGIAKVGHLEKW